MRILRILAAVVLCVAFLPSRTIAAASSPAGISARQTQPTVVWRDGECGGRTTMDVGTTQTFSFRALSLQSNPVRVLATVQPRFFITLSTDQNDSPVVVVTARAAPTEAATDSFFLQATDRVTGERATCSFTVEAVESGGGGGGGGDGEGDDLWALICPTLRDLLLAIPVIGPIIASLITCPSLFSSAGAGPDRGRAACPDAVMVRLADRPGRSEVESAAPPTLALRADLIAPGCVPTIRVARF